MKISYSLFVWIVTTIVFSSCGGNKVKTLDETPTRGNIRIAVDESFTLMTDAEIYTFQSLYRYAKINPLYTNEVNAIDYFIKDSVNTILITRELTANEKEYLNSKKLIPRTTKVAHDAIAFIINNENKDTLINFNKVKDLFTGKISKWNEINNSNNTEEIRFVFDNKQSGNIRYFDEYFKLNHQIPKNFAAVENNNEVISWVKNHVNAVGIVSVNWISDKSDSTSMEFLKDIKVASISSNLDPEGEYYKPYQAYIANNFYPFTRDVYMICKETFTGLGSGFLSFVAGEKGQRIILKSKLVPATMPVRLVRVKQE